MLTWSWKCVLQREDFGSSSQCHISTTLKCIWKRTESLSDDGKLFCISSSLWGSIKYHLIIFLRKSWKHHKFSQIPHKANYNRCYNWHLNVIYMNHHVIKLSRTHPEELGLQETLQHLVAAFPLRLLLQDALQEDPDLSDLGVCREQIHGLEKHKKCGLVKRCWSDTVSFKRKYYNSFTMRGNFEDWMEETSPFRSKLH